MKGPRISGGPRAVPYPKRGAKRRKRDPADMPTGTGGTAPRARKADTGPSVGGPASNIHLPIPSEAARTRRSIY
jgi:hypothetical protein